MTISRYLVVLFWVLNCGKMGDLLINRNLSWKFLQISRYLLGMLWAGNLGIMVQFPKRDILRKFYLFHFYILMVPYHHASSINLINMFLLGQTKLSGGTYYENFLLELNHIYFNSLSYVKFYATITLFLKSDCNREKIIKELWNTLLTTYFL